MRATAVGVCVALLAGCTTSSGEEGEAPPGTFIGVQVQASDDSAARAVTGFSIRVWRDGDEGHPFFDVTRALRADERPLAPRLPQEIIHPRTRAGDERVVVEATLLRDGAAWVSQRARLRFVPTWAQRLYLTLNPACVDRPRCPDGETCGGDGSCVSIDTPTVNVWRPRGASASDASLTDATADAAIDAPLAVDGGCVGAACDDELTTIAAGGDTTCVRTRGGAVSCWGANLWDATDLTAPRAAVSRAVRAPSFDGARALSMELALCAVTAEGGLRCAPSRALPAPFRRLTGVRSVVVGRGHACALLGDSTVRCAGDNGLGQCGESLTETPQSLVAVEGLARADSLYTRGNVSCALDAGALFCWGSNRGSVLTAASDPPLLTCAEGEACRGRAALVSGVSGVVRVATALDPTSALSGLGCSLDTMGSVRCWGHGLVSGAPPTAVVAPPGEAIEGLVADDVQGGDGFVCALTRGGGVSCWGRADGCRLGRVGAEGEVVARPFALPVTGARAIAVGARHACALLAGSRVVCWGDASSGQLGHGSLVAPAGCAPVEVSR